VAEALDKLAATLLNLDSHDQALTAASRALRIFHQLGITETRAGMHACNAMPRAQTWRRACWCMHTCIARPPVFALSLFTLPPPLHPTAIPLVPSPASGIVLSFTSLSSPALLPFFVKMG